MAILTVFLYAMVVVLALLLIGIVLIQPAKSGGMGAAFGGIGESVFGAKAGSHLTKATVIMTSLFFAMALALAALIGRGCDKEDNKILKKAKAQNAPAATVPAPKKTDASEKKDVPAVKKAVAPAVKKTAPAAKTPAKKDAPAVKKSAPVAKKAVQTVKKAEAPVAKKAAPAAKTPAKAPAKKDAPAASTSAPAAKKVEPAKAKAVDTQAPAK